MIPFLYRIIGMLVTAVIIAIAVLIDLKFDQIPGWDADFMVEAFIYGTMAAVLSMVTRHFSDKYAERYREKKDKEEWDMATRELERSCNCRSGTWKDKD